jgi:hypothetical protein
MKIQIHERKIMSPNHSKINYWKRSCQLGYIDLSYIFIIYDINVIILSYYFENDILI